MATRLVPAILICVFAFVSFTHAAPVIQNVTPGALSHRATININGINFGTKNPAAPVYWDDMESRTVNTPNALISEGGFQDFSPRINTYSRQSAADPTYDLLQYRAAPFRGVTGPHVRSSRFMAGGHNPFRKLTVATYRWTLSAQGTNEYYCELSSGGNPSWGIDAKVGYFMIGSSTFAVRGTKGSLADQQWDYGDNDSLGYNTWYFRSNAGDPDIVGTALWGGPNDLEEQQVNPNVMAMVCVPPQGGVANCSPSQTWTNLFVHYYTTYDPQWPTFASGGNEKIINFEEGNSIYVPPDYYTHGPYVSTTPNQIGLNSRCGNDPCNPGVGRNNCFSAPKGIWNKWEWHVTKGASSTIDFYVNNTSRLSESCSGVCRNVNKTGVSIGGYYCLRAPGFSDCSANDQKVGHPDAFRYFDDVYVDNTRSRVMLANNSIYENATIIEPQIPSAWSATSVTVTVNLGRLPDNRPAYLFIFDSTNSHNPVGRCVPIGTGVCTGDSTSPAPPLQRR